MKANEMMKKVVMAAVVPAMMGVVVGCVEGRTPEEKFHSRMRAKPAPMSDFLPNHNLLVKQANTFPFHYFYLKENTLNYDNIYIAPVDTSKLRESDSWGDFDKAMAGNLGKTLDDFTSFMRKAYVQAFERAEDSSHLKVSERSDLPHTLILETAIIALVPTKAELNAAGIAASFAVPGIGIVTSALGGGSITVECRVRDAETKEIVAMYATTETEPRALFAASQFAWTSSARINVKQIAAYTASVLSAKDYREIKRRFPVRWTSLIKDASLDEEK